MPFWERQQARIFRDVVGRSGKSGTDHDFDFELARCSEGALGSGIVAAGSAASAVPASHPNRDGSRERL